MLQREGSPGYGDRREKVAHRESHKESISPRPLSGKIRGFDFHEYYNHRAQRLEFWTSVAGQVWKPEGQCSVPVEKKGR